MGHKAVEITCNIKNSLGPGIASERTVQWWFKKFCKGNESLEDEECRGWPLESDSKPLKTTLELILLNYIRSCLRTYN